MQRANGTMIGVGDVLDAYVLEAVLASGTTSTTFRARDQRLERPVVLKVLHGELFAGVPGARERAVGDATLAASLEHPNIVPVYGAGEAGDGLWIASRLTDGETLADTAVTPRRAIELLERVAEAIDAAHAIGAVHREIRPECIVLDRWGNPLIRDYGVTRTSGRTGLATRMELIDTLRYAAPELVLGRGATPAADIFGLAATAVFCLTAAHPFPDLPISQLVAMRTQAAPPALAASGVDATELNAALAAGMALDPDARPRDAAELVALLRRALQRIPAHVAQTPAPFTLAAAAPPAAAAAPPDPLPSVAPVPAAVAPVPAAAPPPPPGGATRIERRREPEPEPEPEVQPRPWATIALCAICVIALGAGAAGIGGMSAPQAPDPLRAGIFELVPGSTWHAAPIGEAPQLQFEKPVVLELARPGAARASVGVLTTPGPPGNPLAGEPLGAFADEPEPALVRVGDRTMVRYRGTLSAGGAVTVFVLPTSAGGLAVACSEPAAEARCAALLATARLGGARTLAPQPPEDVATAVADTIRQLETARHVAGVQLRSREEGVPAQAASTVAEAYGTAAQALKLSDGDPGTREQIRRIGRAAQDASLDYQDLAGALDTQEAILYRVARLRALNADRALARAIRGLERSGYQVR